MPIAVHEEFGSREGDGKSQQLKWIVIGSDDDTAIDAALAAVMPLTYRGLPRQGWPTTSQKGYQLWEAVATYGTEQNDEGGGEEDNDQLANNFQFDTTGGSGKILLSKATRWYPRALTQGKTGKIDFKNLINVHGKDVEGCEIIIPKLKFSTKRMMSPARLTWAYLKSLARATGKTNSGAWQTFEAGELLFLGASGERDTSSPAAPVTFNFEASENIPSMSLGGIEGIRKDGWEFLWVNYEPTEDTEASALPPRPLCVYVEKVYDDFNFADLQL